MAKQNDRVKLPSAKLMSSAWRRASVLLDKAHEHASCNTDADGACVEEQPGCCRRHAVVLPGYGKKDFPFPSSDELVARAIAYFNALAREYAKRGQRVPLGQKKVAQSQPEAAEQSQHNCDCEHGTCAADDSAFLQFVSAAVGRPGRRQLFTSDQRRDLRNRIRADVHSASGAESAVNLPRIPKPELIPDLSGLETPSTGPVLRVAAGTLAQIMHEGRFKATIARQFDVFKGACNWALGNMPAKYQEAAASLLTQLAKLEEIYGESLPRVLQFLSAQYPTASEDELLNAAVAVLNEQLSEILYILSIWTDAFAQKRDGLYPQLDYVVFTLEQALHLFATGDLQGEKEGEESTAVKTRAFNVHDAFMPRFSDQGPATIPGGRGPCGAHAVEVPFDEAEVLLIFMVLYLHEFFHDFYNDVEGLADDMTGAVVTAIQDCDKAGKFKFSSPTIKLGKQTVRTIDMITQIYAQTLSENAADVAGGVMQSGESFLYSMEMTFGAFNMRGTNAFAANRLLRHDSWWMAGEQGEMGLEPHMPDFMRAHLNAAALDLLGFHAAAEEGRKLADTAAGLPMPKEIVWRNADPKSRFKFDIRVPVEDLKLVAPVVVDAIINAPLPSLGNRSIGQLVNWTPKRQAKVDALTQNLMKGKADVPFEMGDFTANYVAAAAIKAVWGLWKDGSLPPMFVAAFVEKNARKMMDAVKAKFEEPSSADASKKSSSQS